MPCCSSLKEALDGKRSERLSRSLNKSCQLLFRNLKPCQRREKREEVEWYKIVFCENHVVSHLARIERQTQTREYERLIPEVWRLRTARKSVGHC
jgi:hypothetical protein